MTDLSNMSRADLDHTLKCNNRTIAEYGEQNKAIVAEIERRKAEPDWAAWEPKWQAFRIAAGFGQTGLPYGDRKCFIRALIAAHNTPLTGGDIEPLVYQSMHKDFEYHGPLAGENWTEYRPEVGGSGPEGVSPKTHEIEVWADANKLWAHTGGTMWFTGLAYRYRPKQTDGWIPWTGGECPVHQDALVDLELRSGDFKRSIRAKIWYWYHAGERCDIIAYRVVKEP